MIGSGTFKPNAAGLAAGLTSLAISQMDPSVLKHALETGLGAVEDYNPMTLGYDLGHSIGQWLNPPDYGIAADPIMTDWDIVGKRAEDALTSQLFTAFPDMEAWAEQNLGEDYNIKNILDYMGLSSGVPSGTIPQDDYIGQSTDIAALQPGYFGEESIEYKDLLSYLAAGAASGTGTETGTGAKTSTSSAPGGGKKDDDKEKKNKRGFKDDDKVTNKDRLEYIDNEIKRKRVKEMIERQTAKRKADFPLSKFSNWGPRYRTGGKKTIQDFLVNEILKKNLNPVHWMRTYPRMSTALGTGTGYQTFFTEEGWKDWQLPGGVLANIPINAVTGLAEMVGDFGAWVGLEERKPSGANKEKYAIGADVENDVLKLVQINVPTGNKAIWGKIPDENFGRHNFYDYVEIVPIKETDKVKEKAKAPTSVGENIVETEPTTTYSLNDNIKAQIDSIMYQGGYDSPMLRQIVKNNPDAKKYISNVHFYEIK